MKYRTKTNSDGKTRTKNHDGKDTIFMIHGMWCNGEHLVTLAKHFEKKSYKCIRVTLPGHSPDSKASELQNGNRSIRDYVDFLENQLLKLKMKKPPIILGHSLGGLLAQLLAQRVRVTCKALVLLAPVPPAQVFGMSISGARLLLPAFLTPGFWRKTQLPSADRFAHFIYNGLSRREQETLYPTFVRESGRATFESSIPFLDRNHASQMSFDSVQCSVFVGAAGRDKATPPRIARAIAKRYDRGEFRLYSRMSHWMITEPGIERVVNDVVQWLHGISNPDTKN